MLIDLHFIHRFLFQPFLDYPVITLALGGDVSLPAPKLLCNIFVKLALPDRVRGAVPASVAVTAVAGVFNIFLQSVAGICISYSGRS